MSANNEMLIWFPGGKRVNAEYLGRIIETDQSQSAGGEGSAPEPFTLFLASIGTCAGIYVLRFLQTRGLSSEGVQLRQSLRRDDKGHIAGFELDIDLPDTVPAKYHDAIRRAAEMCAVKKVVENGPEFHVSVRASNAVGNP